MFFLILSLGDYARLAIMSSAIMICVVVVFLGLCASHDKHAPKNKDGPVGLTVLAWTSHKIIGLLFGLHFYCLLAYQLYRGNPRLDFTLDAPCMNARIPYEVYVVLIGGLLCTLKRACSTRSKVITLVLTCSLFSHSRVTLVSFF